MSGLGTLRPDSSGSYFYQLELQHIERPESAAVGPKAVVVHNFEPGNLCKTMQGSTKDVQGKRLVRTFHGLPWPFDTVYFTNTGCPF